LQQSSTDATDPRSDARCFFAGACSAQSFFRRATLSAAAHAGAAPDRCRKDGALEVDLPNDRREGLRDPLTLGGDYHGFD